MVIPRIRLSLKPQEILRFICNLFSNKSEKASEELILEFEQSFAARYGLKRGLAVSKARVALFLLLKTLPLKKGGEVIISALHIADFVNMIRLAGFVPIVADLQHDNYCVDYDDLEKKISSKTVLFIVTSLSGYAPNMECIQAISNKYHIPFVEDCSQAVESYYNGQRLGSFGIASIFSLSLAKPICTISGGMILSKDENLLNEIRKIVKTFNPTSKVDLALEAIKNLAIKLATSKVFFRWFTFPSLISTRKQSDLFSNYQKSNKTVVLRQEMPKQFLSTFCWQQAKLGLSQLETMEGREHKKVKAGSYLFQKIASNDKVRLPTNEKRGGNSFWLFPVIAENAIDLKHYLFQRKIDTSGLMLSCLADEPSFADLKFDSPNARKLKQSTLFLPMYSNISQVELDQIIKAMTDYGQIRK
jgi:dTDP-4-amino-4,6-dideoxygalactose transaminase